ncbi:TPA: hypothetical protein ACTYOM_002430, partial [Klebsiella pneumoniae]
MALTLLATNNAESTLASAISATDTSLIVSAGTGAEFPDAVAGESYFKLTITDAATGSQVEIVNVTAKAGDIFTIERAQEGTLARAWAANDMVANMMTADTLNVIADFAKQASDSAEEAQGYALSASEFGDNKSTFADTAAGLAATTSGQYFRVPQGTGNVLAFRYYKNNSGVAQEVAEYPGQGSITNTIREFPTLEDAQADADAGNILVGGKCWVTDSTGATLAVEYVNNAGTLTATGRKMPSYDSLKRSNILFDAFNEQSAEQLTFASWDWYKGATPAFSTTDVNLPLPTPVIQASGVTSFDKYYDVSKLQVKPGDTLTFSVLVWFENAGGKLQIYWLDSAGATITTGEASPLNAGVSSPMVSIAVPSGAVSIRIRVQNTVSGAFKIGAYAAAIGDVTPEFTRSFPSKAYQEALGTPDNLVYDPFGEMLSVRPKQGLPAGVVDAMSYAGTLIQNSANSPWGKTGIQNTSGVGADR